MREHKTIRYLKYAIGEIILVVIGILIALQINNWNEQRKSNAFEQQLLHSFKNGLEEDLADIKGNVKWHQRGMVAADTLIYLLENDVPFDLDDVSRRFSDFMTPTFFQYSTSAFETLKSKGITTISNEELRNDIIRVYDSQYNFFLRFQSLHLEVIEKGYSEVLPTRFESSYKYDLTKPDFPGSLRPLNFDSLRNDQEFLYFLKSLRNRSNILVEWQYGQLTKRIVNLKEEIDKELFKLESE